MRNKLGKWNGNNLPPWIKLKTGCLLRLKEAYLPEAGYSMLASNSVYCLRGFTSDSSLSKMGYINYGFVLQGRIPFLSHVMKQWKIKLILNTGSMAINYVDVNIKCGISEGFSLSNLFVCLPMISLSKLLNETNCGYKVHGKTMNHLHYMDDLKLLAKNENQWQMILLQTVNQFSEDSKWNMSLTNLPR